MIRLSGHVCSRPKVPDKRVFRITESPIGPDVEIGSRIFVRTSEISGLSEPGLTNHHRQYQTLWRINYTDNLALADNRHFQWISVSDF